MIDLRGLGPFVLILAAAFVLMANCGDLMTWLGM